MVKMSATRIPIDKNVFLIMTSSKVKGFIAVNASKRCYRLDYWSLPKLPVSVLAEFQKISQAPESNPNIKKLIKSGLKNKIHSDFK